MKHKPKLNMDKIAKTLGAERRGEVRAGSGHFGAMQVVAEIQARFQAPAGGGRSTDPAWTDRRLVPLAPKTLLELQRLASIASERGGVKVSPLQVAALLLEHATEEADDGIVAELTKQQAS
ncbi:MAG: hypothetical protein GXP55_10980 [Deltaproteobacteria bacterium]|nr:hypothetical protein [Deltaproteobacteria bacterium]